ncbi:sugar phosphate isomerase/epimerase [Novosphingobium sp. FKTRR1]|uniref:sugar phosphate isomerase/epimerase family protein n=1 Tax=Novosphingobium sp. FKTRR1 TaxID=2879118 RepID=UPI001CF02F51|nr:TIM barrel protein [Novosphingobium sp. FKTRR1]
MQRLALDHITAIDSDPFALTLAARAAGCDAVCLFMQPMDVLPLMPTFDIYKDLAARRDLQRRMDDQGVVLDVAYPFTLAGRTEVQDFCVAMECAADLDAMLLNVLVYDRDPARRVDRFGAFCDLAASFGHKVGVEFYPPSQVGSLASALELVQTINRPGEVGINADLLHLMRAGERVSDLAAAPKGTILYGQLADGPALAPANLDYEASSERLLAGEGGFDLVGFVRALPPDCPLSVEIPRDRAVTAGVSRAERVALAVDSVRRAMGWSTTHA